ncbi:unnamed protein product [Pipistrellus nathusii]|uniref:Uncharacterized protein n=1 Tax=Pipistrellus nathusii TaxID=59473 RepID=A0ABP0A2P3_PIPNA
MFSTKDRANTAKFDLTLISLVQTKGIINHLKCKLIIVNYILAWSASTSNVFFCISLDIFRITFSYGVQTREVCTDLCIYLTKFPNVISLTIAFIFHLNSKFRGCDIYELHFQKEICKN